VSLNALFTVAPAKRDEVTKQKQLTTPLSSLQAETELQKANVHKVLREIGLETDPETQHFEVWNKIDLMGTLRHCHRTDLAPHTRSSFLDLSSLDNLVSTQRVLGKHVFPISAHTGASESLRVGVFISARSHLCQIMFVCRRGMW
jgi:50S ribosomal subunit-associated GTPase HflX